jgi:uncharacterized protein (TIGR00730 family)
MKSLCVFCGSSQGKSPHYITIAKEMGMLLAHKKIRLIYGGSNIGLMQVIADACLQSGGEVIGVITQYLAEKNVAHHSLTRQYIVPTMHERKQLMAELAEGFIAFPGGMGTLEELFEMLTWTQLGLHQKPCGLLNINGYFDKLLLFLDHTVKEGFMKKIHQEILLVDHQPAQLLQLLGHYQHHNVDKWI